MKGNRIILSAPFSPRGVFTEGILSGTVYPGQIVQPDPTVAMVGGRNTYVPYDTAYSGYRTKGGLYIVYEDDLQGKKYNDQYASGSRIFLYTPAPGEEFNLLLKDTAGTGDDHTAGTLFIPEDGTGRIMEDTGTSQLEPFLLMEDITDPTDPTWAWVRYSGN